MTKTTVVNINKTDKYDVYIGRPGKGQDGIFGNPYHKCSREKNVADFKNYFYQRLKEDSEYKQKILSLRGKTLGCFCVPKLCHGNVIADYLNSLDFQIYAVIGCRYTDSEEKYEFDNYNYIEKILAWFDIKKIVSGGAIGADKLAKRYAKEHNIAYEEYLPDWNRFGKSAGFRRNITIVDKSDAVIAFYNGISKDTKHSIDLAEKSGKPVYIFWPTLEEEIENLG